MNVVVDVLRVAFGIFVLGSLASGRWTEEAKANLVQSGLGRATTLKIGSWVQAAWLYGLPAWLLWDWRVALLHWLALGCKMALSVGRAEAELGGGAHDV